MKKIQKKDVYWAMLVLVIVVAHAIYDSSNTEPLKSSEVNHER